MAGGNKSGSLKTKKRKVQEEAKARADAEAKRHRAPSWQNRGSSDAGGGGYFARTNG